MNHRTAHPEMAGQAELQNPEHGLPESFGAGWPGRILFWIAVAFSTFQIVTAFGVPLDRPLLSGALGVAVTPMRLAWAALALWAVWVAIKAARGRPVAEAAIALATLAAVAGLIDAFSGTLPSQVVRALHVGFLGLVAGGMLANHRARTRPGQILAWACGAAAFGVGLYQWTFYEPLLMRAGYPTTLDLVVGAAAIVLLFWFVWRIMGPALVIVAGLFLAYCLFGQHLPAPFDHRGYPFEQVVEHMAYGTEGIYGVATYVSATYIFLFILFGAFLERAGMIGLFTDIAMGLFGGARGGPGQGRGVLLGADGDDLGLGRRQRRLHRAVHHPADEALRLSPGVRGRRRGDGLHGRADHAAGDGRGRLHHGRDARRRLRRDRQGGDHPGRPLLRLGVPRGAPRGRQAGPRGPAARRASECRAGGAGEVAPDPAARRPRLPPVRRLHAALRRLGGPGADGAPHPRGLGRARDRRAGGPHPLLGRRRPPRRCRPLARRNAGAGPRPGRRGGEHALPGAGARRLSSAARRWPTVPGRRCRWASPAPRSASSSAP